jgi:hypothetical protein
MNVKENVPMAQTMQLASSGLDLVIIARAPLCCCRCMSSLYIEHRCRLSYIVCRCCISSLLKTVIKHLVSDEKSNECNKKNIPTAQTMLVHRLGRLSLSLPLIVAVHCRRRVIVVVFVVVASCECGQTLVTRQTWQTWPNYSLIKFIFHHTTNSNIAIYIKCSRKKNHTRL